MTEDKQKLFLHGKSKSLYVIHLLLIRIDFLGYTSLHMIMPKDYAEFQESLSNRHPPENWSKIFKALWHDAKGDWHSAHEIVDGMANETAQWIHAYLHRKEGDDWNAGYWYQRAGKSFPKASLDEELQELVEFVLSN